MLLKQFLGALKYNKGEECYYPINKESLYLEMLLYESTLYFVEPNNKLEQWREMSALPLLITSETN